MNLIAMLEERLTDASARAPYELALAMEGHPLSRGRRLYALADVLDVQPGDLMCDLARQYGEEQVEATLGQMERMANAACDYFPS